MLKLRCWIAVRISFTPSAKGGRRAVVYTNSSPQDKVGGRPTCDVLVRQFQDFMIVCNLLDLDFNKLKLTWTNMRIGREAVVERLNKVLMNLEWRFISKKAVVLHEAYINSDHRPLVLGIL
ncbi:conserved hypothetical protein [Ricinus communis]|uniref:Endonuclease/exonuclease/phosphatase domain-containing protein n=1 Tax=Ricinus communis TaxID=3988 RepID=B9SEW1_RICCO|nr:conserved hypothetical protein [Ricinus communis]